MNDQSPPSSPLMEATNLVKEFTVSGSGAGARKRIVRAVDDVSLSIGYGETLALVGESGSGKSTTARMLARLMDIDGGEIRFEGQEVGHLGTKALRPFRSSVQVVFQDPYSSLNPRHSVERLVTAPLAYQKRPIPGGARAFTKGLMERVGLNPDHSTRLPSQFSGGQAQRIGIARALAVGAKLVICDEAVSALDVSVQAQVMNLLQQLREEEGFSYLFIAHDLAVVRQIADRVAVMSAGKIVESGTRDQVFDDPQHEYTRTLLSAVPRIRPEWEAARRRNRAHTHGAEPTEPSDAVEPGAS